jgi:sec-independent protein translocase protein TatA
MPFALQPLDIVVILVLALILFGPQKLPEIGRGIGKALTEFRKGAREMTQGFTEEVTKPMDASKNKIDPNPASSQPVANASRPAAATPVELVQQAAPSKVFCNQCGAPNPVTAEYCNMCGGKVVIE